MKDIKTLLQQTDKISTQPRQDNTITGQPLIGCLTELDAEFEPERFVPLPPTETGYRRDREHCQLKGPKFLQPVVPAVCRSELYLG